jgi:hypothetical protein
MIQVLEVKNCEWANPEHTVLNCDARFSHYPNEFMPFSAVASGDTDYAHKIFADALAGVYGEIAEYVPPPAPTAEELAFTIRAARDRMLAETDWTQNGDVPQATKDLWMPYRQALRDITDQPDFPNSVVWPVPPQ